jgi:hypothetical protein
MGGIPLGEEGVRASNERGLEASPSLVIRVFRLPQEIEAERFISECVNRIEGALVVGLPERFYTRLSLCALKAAFLYTAEDLVIGTRIRNKAILFLMNLLGLRQARDVVEAVDTVFFVVVIAFDEDLAERTSKFLERSCGALEIKPPECNVNVLADMAAARLSRIA